LTQAGTQKLGKKKYYYKSLTSGTGERNDGIARRPQEKSMAYPPEGDGKTV